MNLNYFLNLGHLQVVNTKHFDDFFRLADEIVFRADQNAVKEISEKLYRENDGILTGYVHHKSGENLCQLIFSMSGEVGNRIIPSLWNKFRVCDNPDDFKFGPIIEVKKENEVNEKIEIKTKRKKRKKKAAAKENDDSGIHSNAVLLTKRTNNDHIWEIAEIEHYNQFRNHHLMEKILSADCDDYIPLHLPKCSFIKSALDSYKKLDRGDKEKVISDLKRLNDFIISDWKNGDFSIEQFKLATGVDASDESDPTKENPKLKSKRLFNIPGIGSVYCFLHIKISNTYRIHFHPDPATKKAHIAYVGTHLPTAKFK